MRAMSRVGAALATSVCAAAVAAPAAIAAPPAGGEVAPTSGRPGTTVQVRAYNCTGGPATATSRAFHPRTVHLRKGAAEGTFGGTARVAHVRPGSYQVHIKCPGGGDTVTFRVLPRKGARGGLGGSTDGMNPAALAAGTGLIAAAAGGGLYLMRRRQAGSNA